MFALLLLAADTAAPFPKSDYAHCMERQVVELEPSGELPHDVALAAAALCAREGLVWAKQTGTSIELLDKVTSLETEALSARVVQIRACRKTRACKS